MIIDDDTRRKNFLAKHPAKKLSLNFRHVPHDFGRLMAKIGYGQVLTQLDPGDFRPICVPYILGYKANVSYVVGGTFKEQVPERNNGYSLMTVGFGSADRLMLVALVRLLANTSAPAYHVVVGDVIGADRVERIIQKLGIIIDRVDTIQNGTLVSIHHWLPKVMPLPFWAERVGDNSDPNCQHLKDR